MKHKNYWKSITYMIGMMFVTGVALSSENEPELSVSCGKTVEAEFSPSIERHVYKLSLSPGDSLEIKVNPIGEYLGTNVEVFEPMGHLIERKYAHPPGHLSLKTKLLSGRGTYTIKISNQVRHQFAGRAGLYIVKFVCTLRDGTVISEES